MKTGTRFDINLRLVCRKLLTELGFIQCDEVFRKFLNNLLVTQELLAVFF